MLNDLKDTLKDKFRLSDKQLKTATKLAKGAEWWCASGVAFWGGAVVLGLAVLGLQALGLGIPTAIGMSTLIFGAVMAAKSVVLQQAFRALHKKGVTEQQNRLTAKGLPTPSAVEPALRLAKVLPARAAFNIKVKEFIALLPHPGAPGQRKREASAANSRLRL
jgi:hypothetical protein